MYGLLVDLARRPAAPGGIRDQQNLDFVDLIWVLDANILRRTWEKNDRERVIAVEMRTETTTKNLDKRFPGQV